MKKGTRTLPKFVIYVNFIFLPIFYTFRIDASSLNLLIFHVINQILILKLV